MKKKDLAKLTKERLAKDQRNDLTQETLSAPNGGKKFPDYVPQLKDNLFCWGGDGEEGLTEDHKRQFEDGDGGELNWTPPKMQSVLSSSALAVNFFAYLATKHNTIDFWNALFFKEEKFLTGDVAEASFEKKLRIKDVRGIPPNLDFFISDTNGNSDENGNMIGIESKFTEPLDCKSKNKKSIQEAYFKTPFLDENKNKKAFELAQSINNGSYQYLDAAQLLKHWLGLMSQCKWDPKKARLIYIYHSCASGEHKEELDRFTSEAPKAGINFVHYSYNEMIARLESCYNAQDPDDTKHLEYLRKRYYYTP